MRATIVGETHPRCPYNTTTLVTPGAHVTDQEQATSRCSTLSGRLFFKHLADPAKPCDASPTHGGFLPAELPKEASPDTERRPIWCEELEQQLFSAAHDGGLANQDVVPSALAIDTHETEPVVAIGNNVVSRIDGLEAALAQEKSLHLALQEEVHEKRRLCHEQKECIKEARSVIISEKTQRRDIEGINFFLIQQLAGGGSRAAEFTGIGADNGVPPGHGQLKTAFLRRLCDDFASKMKVAISSLEPGSNMLEFQRLLGAGTFGAVSMVWCETAKKSFAVKRCNNGGNSESMLREGRALLMIPPHQNLIGVEAICEIDPVTIMLELGSCDMLQAIVSNMFTQPELLAFMEDMAHGVSHMHEHGTVHGDLKFANTIIVPLGNSRHIAKVTDLGLTYVKGEMKPPCSGTLGTLAPENYFDEIAADPSQDVFGLGAMLIMLTVHRPLLRHNMFAHEMLWTTEDRRRMEPMNDMEKERFLAELSWHKMRDTSDQGFAKTVVRRENMQAMPLSVEAQACGTMRLMVHADPLTRPKMPVIKTFMTLLVVGARHVVTARSALSATGATAGGGSTDAPSLPIAEVDTSSSSSAGALVDDATCSGSVAAGPEAAEEVVLFAADVAGQLSVEFPAYQGPVLIDMEEVVDGSNRADLGAAPTWRTAREGGAAPQPLVEPSAVEAAVSVPMVAPDVTVGNNGDTSALAGVLSSGRAAFQPIWGVGGGALAGALGSDAREGGFVRHGADVSRTAVEAPFEPGFAFRARDLPEGAGGDWTRGMGGGDIDTAWRAIRDGDVASRPSAAAGDAWATAPQANVGNVGATTTAPNAFSGRGMAPFLAWGVDGWYVSEALELKSSEHDAMQLTTDIPEATVDAPSHPSFTLLHLGYSPAGAGGCWGEDAGMGAKGSPRRDTREGGTPPQPPPGGCAEEPTGGTSGTTLSHPWAIEEAVTVGAVPFGLGRGWEARLPPPPTGVGEWSTSGVYCSDGRCTGHRTEVRM